MRLVCHLILGLALFSLTFVSAAQKLRDPTRPPGGVSAASKSRVAESSLRSGMVLQTVLISANRKAAVISGRLMSVGDTISGFRLTKIREGEVEMKGRSGTRTLRLFAAVKKVDSVPAAAPDKKKGQE